MRFHFLALLILFSPASANALNSAEIAELSLQMFSVQGDSKIAVVEKLAASGDKSLIPTFVLAMRWTGSNIHVAKALSTLTGSDITHWHDAYNWQQLHPEIEPHETYRPLKLRFLGNTDDQFKQLFESEYATRERMRIRIEEISWGGVLFDEMPPLDYPEMLSAEDADYLKDTDLVFGVSINGDVRAYPLRILGWHEMLNDVIGGVPVALAYCTLCGSGILYRTQIEGREEPFVFGTSGLLYRSNKLMFDRETKSLWNQFSGEPVVGELSEQPIKLPVLPITITDWANWKNSNPTTTVLSIETGYIRDYGSGVTYREYFASDDLMFPSAVRDESQLHRKDYVFGMRSVGESRAWPLDAFAESPVINDVIGQQPVVLVGDVDKRTVRAYERLATEEFKFLGGDKVQSGTESWRITEQFLQSENKAKKRARLPGHIAYWFAWDSFIGPRSELYSPDPQRQLK